MLSAEDLHLDGKEGLSKSGKLLNLIGHFEIEQDSLRYHCSDREQHFSNSGPFY